MKFYTIEGNKKSIRKVFAIYYICMAIFCLIRISSAYSRLFASDTANDIAYTIIIQVGVLFLLPFLLYVIKLKVKPKEVFEHCNFFKTNFNVILISIALGILCFFINVAVSSLFNGIISFTGYRFPVSSGGSGDYSLGNFFLQIFLVAFLPAVCEEFLHRGILLQGIKHCGFKKAIVISALLFGLIHFNIQQVFYAFIIGLILGFVSVVAKNIYPAMIIHFINNFISTYLDFAQNRGWWLGDILEKLQNFLIENNPFVVFVSVSVVMTIVVFLLCIFIWLLYKQSIIRKINKAINKAYKNFNVFTQDKPICLCNEQEIMLELLEKNTLLNLDFKPMDNPINIVLPKERSRYKSTHRDKVFLWASILLGGLITVFTYIWGLL